MYLETIDLPTLSESARGRQDAPLTLEELRWATGMFPNSKALGEDGIP